MQDAAILARAAGAIGQTQKVLDDLALWMSAIDSRVRVFVCIYRSHPALEMAVSAHASGEQLVELPGVHDAFANSPVAFDRWAVQTKQRNRWRSVRPDRVASPKLIRAWGGSIGPQERIVLTQGARALGYLSVSLTAGESWTPTQLAAIRRRYRNLSALLRLAALDWRARHEPTEVSAVCTRGTDAVLVLDEAHAIVTASPEGRRALAVGELGDFMVDVHKRGWPGRRRIRIGGFELQRASIRSGSGRQFEVVRAISAMANPPLDLGTVDLEDLTPRERVVCEWIVTGETNAAIAARMSVKPSTIKTMLERIYGKLEVRGRVALVERLLRAE